MAFYRAPADRPLLPPGYSYTLDGQRIYINYVANGRRQRLCKPYSTQEQYWTKWENAALAAWMHAYEHKEEKSHAGTTH